MSALAKLRKDFELYARACLKIRVKVPGDDSAGKLEPLAMNRAQLYVQQRLDKQLAERGYVRAIVLKGRQQGMSTFIAGRFYWKASGEFGKKVGILTHHDDATANLFEMVKRYHEHCPPDLRPSTKNNSSNALNFDKLDSGYKIATAGSTAGVGRSSTLQYFHGSEVAFWKNPETHMMGIGQAVPLGNGTEVILESTANGIGNFFHKQWQRAESGESEYEAIFVPWFWQDEYRAKPPAGFAPDEDEVALMDAYGLDIEQIAWRRKKIVDDFDNDPIGFQQEYPNTAAEAFVAVGTDSFIKSKDVVVAKACKVADPYGALVIGVDPARFGKDATAIIRRRGRKAYNPERIMKQDTMHVAGLVANIIVEERPSKVFIDIGGIGSGIYDRLVEMGYGDTVVAVNFGESATDEKKYVNRRAEMWGEMRKWLQAQPSEIPGDGSLHGDLIGPQYKFDSLGRVQLERKEDMAKRGIKSPDLGDALALTFAFPVQADDRPREKWRDKLRRYSRSEGSSMSA